MGRTSLNLRRGLLEKGRGRKKVVEAELGEPASRSSFSLRAEEDPEEEDAEKG